MAAITRVSNTCYQQIRRGKPKEIPVVTGQQPVYCSRISFQKSSGVPKVIIIIEDEDGDAVEVGETGGATQLVSRIA